MLVKSFYEWSKLRNELNHDWLPKKFLNFLNAWSDNIDDMIATHQTIPDDVIAQFESWKNKSEDFEVLINTTEKALSPRQLIDEYPLNSMEESDKVWLKEVIHALYCDRTKIMDSVADLQKLFNDISTQHEKLLKVLNGENDKDLSQLGTTPVKSFSEQVKRFSKMISSLPYEIQVI